MSGPIDDPRARLRHDLRTPLHQIIGYAELVEEELQERGHCGSLGDIAKIRLAAQNALQALEAALPPSRTPSSELQPSEGNGCGSEPAPALARPAAQPGAEPPTARLLVVDDDPRARDLLSRWLGARAFAVETVEDGDAALARLSQGGIDLVLLDIVMPRVSGLDVLVRVRERWPETDLPVIVTTGLNGTEDLVAALSRGANDYICKPLELAAVSARIETQLLLRRQKQELRKLADDSQKTSRLVRGLFGRYLSDEVVSGFLASPESTKLGGEHRHVTLLLSDLRGFTPLTEDLPPEKVLRLLNSYLGGMADVILSHQGTIDEFVGDAILAIFGAPLARPDDAARAVACAVDMQAAVIELNRRNEAEGLPPVEMGIAVHTGDVIVGNIGSERRMKYGVVGSAVNHAGRIESFTVGGQVLVSEATLREAGDAVQIGSRLVIDAKGMREPIVVYELRGAGEASIPETPDEPITLRVALAAICHIVSGKAVQAEAFDARILELAHRGATLLPARRVRVLTNVKLDVPSANGATVEIYAKVVHVSQDGSIGVRFASLPSDAAGWLKRTLAEAHCGSTG